ncbi:MAG: flavodoxin-dependent (E)-4-hydroxy-3-methylbut-2-enyl-diphosphate synthase [Clostridia bacterium]|nr:flavodoxin-dependent (E)-4-hydroxy-3-methylbut-2-enyl-diphosphate synthase [Clostridia bacterium]
MSAKQVRIGTVTIGGGARVAVQSMLSTPSHDPERCVAQARELESAGCEILRMAVPDMEAVPVFAKVKEAVAMPLVADIHFDYRLALEAAAAGADKIRINPGNIGSDDRVKAVADDCARRGIPIRIGVNSGSVEKHILEKYGSPTPQAMVDSAMYHAGLLERFDFNDIVISIKSSSPKTTVEAYRLLSEQTDYPLHIGVTEAGTERMGVIKSAAALGSLLMDGIGDTMRVSLTDDPVKEIRAAKDILRALDLDGGGVNIISCPTCGRTKIDLIGLANSVSDALSDCRKNITVAVMGCVVNGPGEAREADVGIAGGDGEGLVFKKGKIIKKVPESELLSALLKEIDALDAPAV